MAKEENSILNEFSDALHKICIHGFYIHIGAHGGQKIRSASDYIF